MLIDGGDTGSHLDTFYVVDFFTHLNKCLDRIKRLASGRIEVNDDIDIRALCHVLHILKRCVRMHAKAQPHVRRHQQDSVRSGFLCFLCHLNGFYGVLAVDSGDDRHNIAAFLAADFNHTLPLRTGKPCDLTCMAVAHQSLDSLIIESLHPTEVSTELRFIDCIVVI